jgi:hypothetical protein
MFPNLQHIAGAVPVPLQGPRLPLALEPSGKVQSLMGSLAWAIFARLAMKNARPAPKKLARDTKLAEKRQDMASKGLGRSLERIPDCSYATSTRRTVWHQYKNTRVPWHTWRKEVLGIYALALGASGSHLFHAKSSNPFAEFRVHVDLYDRPQSLAEI